MEISNFFNKLAADWDTICEHDPKKIECLLTMCGNLENKRILDVGCGTGILEGFLGKIPGVSVLGIDISERMIEIAVKKYNSENIRFL